MGAPAAAGSEWNAMNSEIAAIRKALAQNPPTAGSFADRRLRWEPLFHKICPIPAGTEVRSIAAGGPAGEWVSAAGVSADETRILFYIHGGGFTAGSAAAYRGLSAHLSAATGARVLAVDYRWAPEAPFPAALEDCVAGYRWLITTAAAAPRRVVLVGDSAGGNLVVAILLALKQAGDALPAAGVCLSAIFDLALTGDSVTSRAQRDPMILASSLQSCASAYRGNADPRDPLMSPLYGDLSGLPPLLLQCGSEEMLRDDSVRLAAKAKAAGVDVTFEEWDEMVHVWHLFADRLTAGRKALARIGEFVRAHIE
ncbi:MAG: alpha/beta hydrolase [Xanthobacteraceae bacterium]